MSIEDELYPILDLNPTEEELIAEAFSSPVVKKYLRVLGNNLVRDYLVLDASSLPEGALAKHHQFVKGQLAILDTLCSINAAS